MHRTATQSLITALGNIPARRRFGFESRVCCVIATALAAASPLWWPLLLFAAWWVLILRVIGEVWVDCPHCRAPIAMHIGRPGHLVSNETGSFLRCTACGQSTPLLYRWGPVWTD